MIDRAEFQEAFRYYDRKVIIEIIDLFLETYKPLLDNLQKSISAGDVEKVIMHAHSLKGLAGTFIAPGPCSIAASLEEKATKNERSDFTALFSRLEPSIEEMAGELRDIRNQI